MSPTSSDLPHHASDDFVASYFRVSTDAQDFAEQARPLVECYQQVFGRDSAWNEGVTCNSAECGVSGEQPKWNFDLALEQCPHCGRALDLCWPFERVVADMRAELDRPDAVCVILRVGEQVVGGSWGFSGTADELEHYLNEGTQPHLRAPRIAERLRSQFPNVERFAYQDEIFVLKEFQGRGFGRCLFALRHREFVDRGLQACVMRTKRNPPSISYRWFYGRWGYEVVAEYPDSDERVILASGFDEVNLHLHR